MIPKGLKIGDTYLEGNLVYKVTAVVGENYEAVWTGETSSEPLEVEQPKLQESVEKAEITREDVNYYEMPYAMLKKLCAEKGLDATGKKSDLIARLEG